MPLHPRLQQKLCTELGPVLLPALHNPATKEIVLNDDGHIWVDRQQAGFQKLATMTPEHSHNLICTIASINHQTITRDQPFLSCEVPLHLSEDTEILLRCQAIIPPVTNRPVFSLRKPVTTCLPLESYHQQAILSSHHYQRLLSALQQKKNMLITGGTGSGKTTLCSALLNKSSTLFPEDRFAILEDTAEIHCPAHNQLHLYSRNHHSMNTLLRHCLRLRPDRIIVGEVRGAEAHSLLKAWNTGHPGGICTIHANSAHHALLRLEQLILEAGITPNPDIIAQTIDVVLFITRIPVAPFYRVTELIVLKGYDPHTRQYQLVETTLPLNP